MIIFWNKVLQQFQKTSASLQAEDLCLNTAYCMLESLSLFIESLQGDFVKPMKGNEGETLVLLIQTIRQGQTMCPDLKTVPLRLFSIVKNLNCKKDKMPMTH